ncbi:sulfatase family protein [Paenibacillus chungangensis]|uniref:Sulfatase n=1 Tax=Paenibacillus chungangensis TaxID=696535 RepID=A0ABW3HXS8_9BACL
MKKPNVIYVFSDQHRAEATGYSRNPDVRTPYMDQLSLESLNVELAVSNTPCCCPYRATLMTGQYPNTHGVFVNDVQLGRRAVSIAEAYADAGYDTGYIGKWHLNGRGRSAFIPQEQRHGFHHWQVLECTHDYNHSHYYEDDDLKLMWDGYDADAQTDSAIRYIQARSDGDKPFFLLLSWGPPHNPYDTAPQVFKDMYDPEALQLRPNVPEDNREESAKDLAGYYAHISALDACLGKLMRVIEETGIAEDTILVYTSDHGDMLGSQGANRKQSPWDESIRVPFLLRYPRLLGTEVQKFSNPFNSPDIMPTMLSLCGISIPDSVEGRDYSSYWRGEAACEIEEVLIQCVQPAGEYSKSRGGREYRGIRTKSYTYVRDLNGPWLLYNNESDPYQLTNLCHVSQYESLVKELDARLSDILKERRDEFLPGDAYVQAWGYEVDETGTVPYVD